MENQPVNDGDIRLENKDFELMKRGLTHEQLMIVEKYQRKKKQEIDRLIGENQKIFTKLDETKSIAATAIRDRDNAVASALQHYNYGNQILSEIEEQKVENNKLQSDITSIEGELRRQATGFDRQQGKQQRSFKREMDALEEVVRIRDEEKVDLAAEKQTLSEQKFLLESKVNGFEQQFKTVERKIEEQEVDFNKMTGRLKTMENESKKQSVEFQGQLELKEAEIVKQKGLVEQRDKEVAHWAQKNLQLTENVEKLTTANITLDAQYELAKKNNKDIREGYAVVIAALQVESDEKQEKITQMLQVTEAITARNLQMSADMAEMEQELAIFMPEVAELEKKFRKTENNYNELQGKASKLRLQATAADNSVIDLEHELKEKGDVIATQTDELIEQKGKVTQLEEQADSIAARNQQLTKNIDSLTETKNTLQIQLEQAINNNREHLRRSDEVIATQNVRLEEQEVKITQMKKEMSKMEQELKTKVAELEKKFEKSESDKKTLRSNLSKLQLEIIEADKKIVDIQAELKENNEYLMNEEKLTTHIQAELKEIHCSSHFFEMKTEQQQTELDWQNAKITQIENAKNTMKQDVENFMGFAAMFAQKMNGQVTSNQIASHSMTNPYTKSGSGAYENEFDDLFSESMDSSMRKRASSSEVEVESPMKVFRGNDQF